MFSLFRMEERKQIYPKYIVCGLITLVISENIFPAFLTGRHLEKVLFFIKIAIYDPFKRTMDDSTSSKMTKKRKEHQQSEEGNCMRTLNVARNYGN